MVVVEVTLTPASADAIAEHWQARCRRVGLPEAPCREEAVRRAVQLSAAELALGVLVERRNESRAAA